MTDKVTSLQKELIIHQRRKAGLFRSLFLWFGMVAVTLFYGALALPSMVRKNADGVHRWAIKWGRSLARLSGTRIHVRHLERLYKGGPVILLCNHQSLFDVPVLYAFLDIPFRWMAKSVLFKIPVIGHAMKAADYIPVERGDSKKALQSMFDAAEQIQNGKSVIIFPEGTRGGIDGNLLPFKKGAFLLAKKAAVTIQPVVLWGNQYVLPREDRYLIQRFYSGNVFVEVLDPIPSERFADLKAEQLSDLVRGVMEEGLGRLKKWEMQELSTKASDSSIKAST
jgi:1-acyl-sn-glycerol-3-phosphate acyltransferase